MPKIKPVSPGHKRQWLRCRECGAVSYHDYVPYSFSNPVRWTRCGHGLQHPDLNCDDISADDALIALAA